MHVKRTVLSVLLVGVAFVVCPGSAAGQVLLRDINDQARGAPVRYLTAVGGRAFFVTGSEVWVTDGSEGGTRLVHTLEPPVGYEGNNNLSKLTPVGDRLVFVAWWRGQFPLNGLEATEVWSTDGTAAGTSLLATFEDPRFYGMTPVRDFVYWLADDGDLWRTDGTPKGSSRIDLGDAGFDGTFGRPVAFRDSIYVMARSDNDRHIWRIDPVSGAAEPVPYDSSKAVSSILAAGENLIYLVGESESSGLEVWVSDGTDVGTFELADVNPGLGSSDPFMVGILGDKMVFHARTPMHGYELWVTDGTAQGTTLLADIEPGQSNSGIDRGVVVDGLLYFAARSDSLGWELWASDGTSAGTAVVRDIVEGSGGSTPNALADVGGTLFFSATDAIHGREVWASDGTVVGTQMVADINPGGAPSSPGYFAQIGSDNVFTATGFTTGPSLFRLDGDGDGAVLVVDPDPENPTGSSQVRTPVVFDDLVFFGAQDPYLGHELWVSDGTPGGTNLFQDLNAGSESSGVTLYKPTAEYLFASGLNGVGSDVLWSIGIGHIDATQLSAEVGGPFGVREPIVVGDSLIVFSARNDDIGREVWISDGTPAGTLNIADIASGASSSSPQVLGVAGGSIVFSARSDASGADLYGYALSGPSAGTITKLLTQVDAVTESKAAQLGDRLVFAGQDAQPFVTDGTVAGTSLLRFIDSGGFIQGLGDFRSAGDLVYFDARDVSNSTGIELWVTDGTTAGTRLVKDINPGSAHSLPGMYSQTAEISNQLLFAAEEDEHGRELWITDGTSAGTRLVADIAPGPSWSDPVIVASNDRVAFVSADDGTRGRELWVTDGSTSGTFLVADLNPGSGSSGPDDAVVLGDLLFTESATPAYGLEPWVFDIAAMPISTEVPLRLTGQLRVTSVYPNPASDFVILEYEGASHESPVMHVFDATGRRVRTMKEEHMTVGQSRMVLDTRWLASGIYMIQLASGDDRDYGRVVVIR